MSYEKLKNNGEESDILSHEHEQVRRMCEGLKRVNAPTNFDFHLKARIANANKSDFQSNAFLPFLRYALPLSLVLMVAGFVVFSGIFTNNQTADSMIVENVQPFQTANSSIVSQSSVSGKLPAENNSNAALIGTKKPNANVELSQMANKVNNSSIPKNNAPDDEFGGTRQSASRDSLVIMPKGISTKEIKTNQSVNIGNANEMSVKGLLSGIGIEASFVNSGWSVKSVIQSSLAARAGIKTGDIIESVDSKKLNTETIAERSVSIKTVHILREGKRIAVELK